MRRSTISLAFVALLVVGCGGSTPVTSIPPINIPSFAIPSIAIPTLPPIDLPSGLPTLPPIVLPSGNPTGGACALVTAEEMAAVFGAAPTITSDETGSCQITPPGEFIPITLRRGENETIAIARSIVDSPQDLTIAGNPALFGRFVGDILYIEKAGQTLVVQAALQEGTQDTLVRIAEAALARFP